MDPKVIGLTESHGMSLEASKNPPPGVEYRFLAGKDLPFGVIKSPIINYLQVFGTGDADLIEAVLSPILTKSKWIYSLACFQEAMAFNIWGIPIPRPVRAALVSRLFARRNFKKLIFWSQAGKDTLATYGGIESGPAVVKSCVVHPAMRKVEDRLIAFRERPTTLTFSGYFFRKGGANVIDCFEKLQKEYKDLKLILCCDERLHFGTGNAGMRDDYLKRIKSNPGIRFGMVPREKLLNEILPATDIFLLPTYTEAFGMAILEAMAFGLPIISTHHMAIPEMISHDESGILIDTRSFDCERLFSGYRVDHIPPDFHEFVNQELLKGLVRLLESPADRKKMGKSALESVRTRFSMETRNAKMTEIYRECFT